MFIKEIKPPKKWWFQNPKVKLACDTPGCNYKKEVCIQVIEQFVELEKCYYCGSTMLSYNQYINLRILNFIIGLPFIRFLNGLFGKKCQIKVTDEGYEKI